jgi:hypothetical protein
MHKIPEKEKLERVVDNYRGGLMQAEISKFSKAIKEGWVKRYRVAMELEQAKQAKKVQAEKGKVDERDIDSDRRAS